MEEFIKAFQTSELLLSDLRDANKVSNSLESIICLQLITKVVEVKRMIEVINESHNPRLF